MDKTALFKLSSGLYVVSATDGEHTGACVINTALQVTSDPLQVAVTVNKDNYTCGVIKTAGHFTLTILSRRADLPLIGRFGFKSSRDFDKFSGIETETSSMFDPYALEGACALIVCATAQTIDVGTHLMFIGEVTDAEVLADDKPLTYEYYHSVLKGKTPPKASSYIDGVDPEKVTKIADKAKLHHFRCMVCGYVYETADSEFPAGFKCPICGFGADKFEQID
jgi:flavin reductase (DIM6/NTAB) family NADH-FMN oxidoreductase RutF/rubredoxin